MAAQAEEAAAEAAASALLERIAERKRQLAKIEHADSSSPPPHSKTPRQYYTLAQLQQKPEELDLTRLEWYLDDKEFRHIFGVEKETFYELPSTRQSEMKGAVELI